jgi:glycosyltransferase involved in cell wall biosynthesis
MSTIVFFCESEAFGGHEKMALAAHAAIQSRYDSTRIQWFVSERNHGLIDALKKAGLDYTALANVQARALWRTPLNVLWGICRNTVKLRRLTPDLVMVVQGNIAISFSGILSARLGSMKCCSYIPMVFRISDVKKYKYPVLADFLWSLLYRLTSSYITIDREQAARLRRENHKASVIVVDNYVPESVPLVINQDARDRLGIPPGKKVLTVIGRMEFRHKCQDWVFREFENDPFLTDKFVLFVGDGSDARTLQDMLVPELRDRFGMIGWKDDPREVYAATDVLVIPSKVEGVPLVMLEALGYRIPVVGTDQDGMRSWLPAQWRFNWGDVEGFKRGIEQALTVKSTEVWNSIVERLAQVQDEDRFATQFSEALTQYCKR